MIDTDIDGYVTIIEFMRIYMVIPKLCEFADELRSIFNYFIRHSLLAGCRFRKESKLSLFDYQTIIKDSSLVRELREIFIEGVMKGM